MRVSTASLLLLLAIQSSAVKSEFAPHRSFARTTERLHRIAKRYSADLARDLRVVFQGLNVEDGNSDDSHKVFCVRPDDPFAALAGNGTTPATGTGGRGGTSARPSPSGTRTGTAGLPTGTSAYTLVESHSGQNFFNGWDFWDVNTQGGDPTHGNVDYQSQANAQSNGLIEINSAGNAIMRVETTPQVSGNRKSVRITTHNTFTTGLFVMDAVHMPEGCGTWPAFWTNGPNWPAGGEIDILEGVHNYTNNQATIHTNNGCALPPGSTAQSLDIDGTLVGGLNCAAAATGNQGCGVRSTSSSTFGSGFNAIGGGVYAMLWDSDGIAVFFFPSGSIPADLQAERPQPNSWGQPMARWPASSCNPSEFFYNHSVIFDTTLCGDWAGAVWGTTGIPGQEQSCAQRTGIATCQQFIQQFGSSFADAYWEVSSVKIYQTTRQT